MERATQLRRIATALLISIGINAMFVVFSAHVDPTRRPTLIWHTCEFVTAPCIFICNQLFPPKDSITGILPCAISFVVYYTGVVWLIMSVVAWLRKGLHHRQ
jgi:hypothetical protein